MQEIHSIGNRIWDFLFYSLESFTCTTLVESRVLAAVITSPKKQTSSGYEVEKRKFNFLPP